MQKVITIVVACACALCAGLTHAEESACNPGALPECVSFCASVQSGSHAASLPQTLEEAEAYLVQVVKCQNSVFDLVEFSSLSSTPATGTKIVQCRKPVKGYGPPDDRYAVCVFWEHPYVHSPAYSTSGGLLGSVWFQRLRSLP